MSRRRSGGATGRRADRSYVSAQCSTGILKVHGILTFADGTVIDGSIENYCVPEGVFRPWARRRVCYSAASSRSLVATAAVAARMRSRSAAFSLWLLA